MEALHEHGARQRRGGPAMQVFSSGGADRTRATARIMDQNPSG